MDNVLVFSHKSKIKCCSFYSQNHLILATDKQICIFELSKLKIIANCNYEWQIMPITIWVNRQSNCIVVQGKMGANQVYQWKIATNKIQFKIQYKTFVSGFCKMVQFNSQLIFGISQQRKSLICLDMLTGKIVSESNLEEQKLFESITCIEAQNKYKKTDRINVFLAQQGCKIFKIRVSQTNNQVFQDFQNLKIMTNQQLKIINSIIHFEDMLYCLLRNNGCLHVISTSGKLKMIHSIDLKLFSPKNLQLSVINQNKFSFFFTQQNKVFQIQIMQMGQNMLQQKKQKWNCYKNLLCQLKQSKQIEFINVYEGNVCGCTEQMQFFLIDLSYPAYII